MHMIQVLGGSGNNHARNCHKISYTYAGPSFLGLTGHLPWVLIGASMDEFRSLSQKIGQNLAIKSSTHL
jgi:hypothetical protein